MDFNYERKQGEKIKFRYSEDGDLWEGEIVGCAVSDQPVLGKGWMVKVVSGQIPNETYMFDTALVFECYIKESI